VSVNAGASGTTASAGYNELVIEGGNEDIGMVFLSPAANNKTQTIAFGDSNNNSIGEISYEHANDAMAFDTNGAERLRIDSSGSVIATSGSLNLVGTNTQMFASANGQDIQFKFSGVKKAQINNGGLISAGDGSEVVPGFRFTDDSNTGMFRATTDTLAFSTAGSEAARIDSSGRLILGATNTSAGSMYFVPDSGGGYFVKHTNSTNSRAVFEMFINGSNVGAINTSGSSTQYLTSSDYRLKEDLQLMSGASERVLALKPVNFAWISTGDRVDGFLAHELAEVVPEAVSKIKDAMRDEEYEVTAAVYEDIIIAAVLDEEGNELEAERTEQRLVTEAVMGTRSVPDMQGIDQSKLVPLLTAALQEALTEISALKVRVAALEAV
jgi:hypothetical protein